MANTFWPLFDLRVKTERLELRPPSDDDLFAMVELAAKGIHAPEVMPFVVPWTRRPSPEQERMALQHHWSRRGTWTPEDWKVSLAVLRDGAVIGSQGISGDQFAIRRTIDTGSWLGRRFQGCGFGKEMRAAALHLAFAGLDAHFANSNAFSDNPASLGVSKSLHYEPNGVEIIDVEGKRVEALHFHLTKERWLNRTKDMYDVTIENLEPCLELFGVES